MSTLRLHCEVYPEAAIAGAASAFEDHATMTVTREGNHWVVNFGPLDDVDGELISNEFANMALGMAIDAGGPAR